MPPPCSCGNFVRGKTLAPTQCHTCWMYYQVLSNHRKHGGTGCWVRNTIIEPCPLPTLSTTNDNKSQKKPGPGTELKNLLAELGLGMSEDCGCKSKENQMNNWGIEGTKEHKEEIVVWLKEQREKMKWGELLTAASKAFRMGFFVNPFDVEGSLVEEAVRRVVDRSRS